MNLIESLKERFGEDFHPAILLGEVIADESNDIDLRVNCAKTLLPYIEATKKAVEVTGNVRHDYGILQVKMFEEDHHQDVIDI